MKKKILLASLDRAISVLSVEVGLPPLSSPTTTFEPHYLHYLYLFLYHTALGGKVGRRTKKREREGRGGEMKEFDFEGPHVLPQSKTEIFLYFCFLLLFPFAYIKKCSFSKQI